MAARRVAASNPIPELHPVMTMVCLDVAVVVVVVVAMARFGEGVEEARRSEANVFPELVMASRREMGDSCFCLLDGEEE